MFSYIEQLSPAEAERLKKTIQDLLRQTCLIEVKYDPVTLEAKNNERYSTCKLHQDFIADYVAVMGCELVYDSMTRIFRLTGEAPLEHLSLFTTKILILLKKIYYDKIMGEGLQAPITNLAEIREYGMNTNLISEKMADQGWNEALGMLKVHQVIELPGAILSLEDDMPIYINPTVNLYCQSTDIAELMERYRIDPAGEEAEHVSEEDIHEAMSE